VGRGQGRPKRTEAWSHLRGGGDGLFDPLALIIEDESHPENARIIGESLGARILLVLFVERDRDHVRLISARRATRHERRRYEEGE
jgi:uncharacterized DUF497 family protein